MKLLAAIVVFNTLQCLGITNKFRTDNRSAESIYGKDAEIHGLSCIKVEMRQPYKVNILARTTDQEELKEYEQEFKNRDIKIYCINEYELLFFNSLFDYFVKNGFKLKNAMEFDYVRNLLNDLVSINRLLEKGLTKKTQINDYLSFISRSCSDSFSNDIKRNGKVFNITNVDRILSIVNTKFSYQKKSMSDNQHKFVIEYIKDIGMSVNNPETFCRGLNFKFFLIRYLYGLKKTNREFLTHEIEITNLGFDQLKKWKNSLAGQYQIEFLFYPQFYTKSTGIAYLNSSVSRIEQFCKPISYKLSMNNPIFNSCGIEIYQYQLDLLNNLPSIKSSNIPTESDSRMKINSENQADLSGHSSQFPNQKKQNLPPNEDDHFGLKSPNKLRNLDTNLISKQEFIDNNPYNDIDDRLLNNSNFTTSLHDKSADKTAVASNDSLDLQSNADNSVNINKDQKSETENSMFSSFSIPSPLNRSKNTRRSIASLKLKKNRRSASPSRLNTNMKEKKFSQNPATSDFNSDHEDRHSNKFYKNLPPSLLNKNLMSKIPDGIPPDYEQNEAFSSFGDISRNFSQSRNAKISDHLQGESKTQEIPQPNLGVQHDQTDKCKVEYDICKESELSKVSKI